MEFRLAESGDIAEIMSIIREAKDFLKEQGVDQWQDGYPNTEIIGQDIENRISHLVVVNGRIVATVAISFEPEDCYEKIEQGNWLCNGPYAVIHRMAIEKSQRGTGIAFAIMKEAESLCKANIMSLRIDTHPKNMPMQALVKKFGYKYCGIVYYDGNERLAFEKLLIK